MPGRAASKEDLLEESLLRAEATRCPSGQKEI
jgi:hypothetical protein